MASASTSAKEKSLRTSKDVYDRIKWDLSESSDVKLFYIGYEDRFEGMQELPFLDYVPGGDIPWHRYDVLYTKTVVNCINGFSCV